VLRLPRRQHHHLAAQQPPELRELPRQQRRPSPPELPDPALVVPHQLPRDPTELPEQLPCPEHQVLGMPGRDHQPEHPPRVPRRHHQHRRHVSPRGDLPVPGRDLRGREPEVVLHPLARRIRRPRYRVFRQVKRAKLRDLLPQHRDRPLPADPLRDHRRRHRRAQRQQLPDRRLSHVRDRAFLRTPVPRHLPSPQRPPHRVLRDPQLPGDRLDPKALRPVQPADLSPLIQSNHRPLLSRPVTTGGQLSGVARGSVFRRRRQQPDDGAGSSGHDPPSDCATSF
jgi:hypothetical protein